MPDEIANNPAPAEDTAAPAPELAPTSDVSTDTESDEQLSLDGEGQAEADALEEVEYEAKKYRLPKELKDALLRQSDYTRKTQEVAEKAKAAEAKEAELSQQREVFQYHAKSVGEFHVLNAQIEPYEKMTQADWQRFAADRPADANAAWIQYGLLKDQRASLVSTLSAQEQERQLKAQRENAKRTEEGRKAIAAQIPGWSTELDNKLREHATTYGFTKDEWATVSDPRAVKVLNDAYQYRQLVARQRAATQTTQPQSITPPPQIGGTRTPTTDLRALASRPDPSAFMKARNKELNGTRR